jgi:hypothetical protein
LLKDQEETRRVTLLPRRIEFRVGSATVRPGAFAATVFAMSLSSLSASPASAQQQPPPNRQSSVPHIADQPDPAARRVLDIEKRRVVDSERFPKTEMPTCDVLVVGGGVGGVAAAEAAARKGLEVIIVEPTRTLGGQFTSQIVPVPDENSHIEKRNGPSTRAYREVRAEVRDYYAQQPNVVKGREQNIGSCWVSRVSGTPDVWEKILLGRMNSYRSGTVVNPPRVIKRHQLRSVGFLANGRVNYADFVDLDSGKVLRIGAQYLLDATEDGLGLEKTGVPTVIGQEAKSEYNEPHAPETARPDWVQSFTYCFVTRWQTSAPHKIVEKPAEYDYFKSLGEYTLDYVYSDARGIVPYKMLTKAENAGGPFWTYRRLLAASNFKGGASPEGDFALINWRGNDFHEESYVGKSLDDQARILERGKAFAQGFLYWLQTECPRDDGSGVGYPEIQLVTAAEVPGIGDDGFAVHPYIRESRRMKAQFMLNENHLVASPDRPGAKWGAEFDDSVGCALYAVDIHPTKGEPPLLFPALPYHIPLGSLLSTAGPVNVLPAAKNFGASRLALASARMHPTEWLVGEIAGSLVAFCLAKKIDDPATVRNTPALLKEFQDDLRAHGITLHWREILEPAP